MNEELCPRCGSFAESIGEWQSFGFFITDYECISCGKLFDSKEKKTNEEMREMSLMHESDTGNQ